MWESDVPDDVIYHGVSWGDMDNNGTIELVIGDYAGILHCFDAATGDTLWNYQFPSNSLYIGPLPAWPIWMAMVFWKWYLPTGFSWEP